MLDASFSIRLKGNFSAATARGGFELFGGSEGIQSLQTGVFGISKGSTNVNISINEVDPNKAVVFLLSSRIGSGAHNTPRDALLAIDLTSPTNINVSRAGNGESCQFVWCVIEFANIKSLQRGVVNAPFNASNLFLVNINTVNVSKSIVVFSYKSLSTANSIGEVMMVGRVLDSTTIRFEVPLDVLSTKEIHWQVVEFN